MFSFLCVLLYFQICLAFKTKYKAWPLNFLKSVLYYFYFILYAPIIECMLSVSLCGSGGYAIVDSTVKCYAGLHIFLICFGIFNFAIAVIFAFSCAFLLTNIEPSESDALAE